MNIFYLGYSLKKSSGGIENYAHTILTYLEESGHNIFVYTLNDNDNDFINLTVSRYGLLDNIY